MKPMSSLLVLACLGALCFSQIEGMSVIDDTGIECDRGFVSRRKIPKVLADFQKPMTEATANQIKDTLKYETNIDDYVECIFGRARCSRVQNAMKSFLWDTPGACKDCQPCERARIRYALTHVFCNRHRHVEELRTGLTFDVYHVYFQGKSPVCSAEIVH